MDRDIGKILQGGDFKSWHFFINYSINHISTHELLWALMAAPKCSWALRCTHELLWVWCYTAMSANEDPWPNCTMLKTTLKLSWVLIAHCLMVPSSWVFMAAHKCSWPIMSTHDHPWAIMRTLISSQEQTWGLMITYDHSWAAMNTHKLGTIKQWALMRA